MNAKTLLLLILITSAAVSKAQTLLNLDSAKIKKSMLSRGGILRGHKKTVVKEIGNYAGEYYLDVYTFPPSAQRRDGIYMTAFFISLNNKCFAYKAYYLEQPYKGELIKKLNKPNSRLKQIRYHQKWLNLQAHYSMEILKNIPVNGKIAPVFTLEVKN